MTELEKKLNAMSPAERKKAMAHIQNQMGMDPRILRANEKKRAAAKKKAAAKKTTKKK